jgi:hypothetical protein
LIADPPSPGQERDECGDLGGVDEPVRGLFGHHAGDDSTMRPAIFYYLAQSRWRASWGRMRRGSWQGARRSARSPPGGSQARTGTRVAFEVAGQVFVRSAAPAGCLVSPLALMMTWSTPRFMTTSFQIRFAIDQVQWCQRSSWLGGMASTGQLALRMT